MFSNKKERILVFSKTRNYVINLSVHPSCQPLTVVKEEKKILLHTWYTLKLLENIFAHLMEFEQINGIWIIIIHQHIFILMYLKNRQRILKQIWHRWASIEKFLKMSKLNSLFTVRSVKVEIKTNVQFI